MKRIISWIKKIVLWFKKKPILSTELLVIILTLAFIGTSYARYLEAVCDKEMLYSYKYEERYYLTQCVQKWKNIEEAEKAINEKVLINAEKEKYSKNEELPYGVYIKMYSKNGRLTEESDEKNTSYHYDSKSYQMAKNRDQYEDITEYLTEDRPSIKNSGIIPNRYYVFHISLNNDPDETGNTDKNFYFCVCIDTLKYIFMYTPFVTEAVVGVVIIQLAGVLIIILKKKKNIINDEVKESKDLFINAIAHEMKTPAAVIINSTECIREGIRPDKKEKYRNNISKEAEHMNKLIDSMLIYTEVTGDNYTPVKKKLVINDIAKDVINRFEILADKKKAKISLDEKCEMIIEGDAQLIGMVVDNYISNATKHCRDNGNITVTVSKNSFCVFNEGGHIAEEELTKIWEPLYKTDKARTESGDSSGMGLAICAEILKLHGLKFGARNVEGGVEFMFDL